MTATWLLLAWAAVHVLVGLQGVYVHDWWWWPLTPGLVMAAGLFVEQVTHRLRSRLRPAVLSAGLVLLLLPFGVWSSSRVMPQFFDPVHTHGGVWHSVVEIGEAIRLAAPDPDDPVIVAYDDPYEVQLWFYGDRPLKLGVWHPLTLHRRIDDGVCDLPWGFRQPWPRPAAAMVFPKQFIPAAPQFVDYMKQNYPVRETELFLIFDLRTLSGS